MRSLAATYRETPAEKGNAYITALATRDWSKAAVTTPAKDAEPITRVAAPALRAERTEASTMEATVKPSGTLCRRMAMKTSSPTLKLTRNAAAIETPSKNV